MGQCSTEKQIGEQDGSCCVCALAMNEHVIINVNSSLMLSRLQPTQLLVLSASLLDLGVGTFLYGRNVRRDVPSIMCENA